MEVKETAWQEPRPCQCGSVTPAGVRCGARLLLGVQYRNIVIVTESCELTVSKIAKDTINICWRSNHVFLDSGAWRMLPGDASTYRARPEPTKWSKVVVGTAPAKQAEHHEISGQTGARVTTIFD